MKEPLKADTTGLYNSRILDTYIKLIQKKYSSINLNELLKAAKIAPQEIADEEHCFNQKQLNLFHEHLEKITKNKNISHEAGFFAASPNCIGAAHHYFFKFLSPAKAFEIIGKHASRFTMSQGFEVKNLSPNKVEITAIPQAGIVEQPFQCHHRSGFLEAITWGITNKRPKIEHSECVFKGGSACRYIVSWERSIADFLKQARSYSAAFFVAGLLFVFGKMHLNLFHFSIPIPIVIATLYFVLNIISYRLENLELKSKLDNFLDLSENLLKQMENSYINATVTNEVGQIISKQMTIEDILNKVIQISQKRLDYDRGLILLSNKERTKLQFRAGFGYPDECLELLNQTDFNLNKPDSKGIFVASYKEQKPFLINEINQIEDTLSPRSLAFAKKLGAKSFICCPIVCDGVSLGIFAVDNLKSKRPLLQSDLDLLMGIASFVGVSIRKAQLQYAQKLESIGTLSGGIAHDFNNMLGSIILNAEMAYDDIPDTEKELKYSVEQVLNTSQRAKELVEQILTFSRDKELERKSLNMGVIVKDTLKMLKAMIPATITIEKHIDNDVGIILADSTQMQQLVMNLCTNAAQAMNEGGGTLKVVLENVQSETSSDLSPVPGSYVKLTISDTGHGISPENKERIFDPFFTTKQPGEGTGLGLSVVHGIVISHGGTITVDSKPGFGTTFEILFPRVDLKVISQPEKSKLIIKGSERILLVDDEEILIDAGKRILERLGYEVFVSTNAMDALALFRKQPDQINLVITDMTMPKMTGIDLSRELLAIRSDLPIIICTGYNQLLTEKKALAAGIREFVMKPFVMSEIAEIIRRVLDRKQGKQIERRGHERFKVQTGAFVKSKYDVSKHGQILDISRKGLAFQYIDRKPWTTNGLSELDLLMGNFSLNNLPVKTVSDVVIDDCLSLRPEAVRRRSVIFGTLANNQTEKIEYFIQHCTFQLTN